MRRPHTEVCRQVEGVCAYIRRNNGKEPAHPRVHQNASGDERGRKKSPLRPAVLRCDQTPPLQRRWQVQVVFVALHSFHAVLPLHQD